MSKAKHRQVWPRLGGFIRETKGAAAVEIAIWLTVLVVPMLSVADIGFYAYKRMELEYATRAAGEAIWRKCDLIKLPATLNCTGYSTYATSAAQASSSLGTAVTITDVSEGYYCQVSGDLVSTGTALSAGTTTCANGATSGDYIKVTGSYSYRPTFRGISVASLLRTPITQTIWMRLN